MGRIKLVLLFVLLTESVISVAQVNRYMIFFTNKDNTGHTVSDPSTYLNARSIERRANQNIDITAEDLPVTAAYIQGIRATGANVLYKTKWMNGVLIECTSAQLATVNALAYVRASDTELVAPGGAGARVRKTNKFLRWNSDDEFTDLQLEMLGIDEMHLDGYTGEGVIIAIMDGGFAGVNTQIPFQQVHSNQINQDVSWNFVGNNSNVYQYSEHGTGVLSVIGVRTEAEFTGGAHKATFQLYVTENVASEYRIEEYNWLFAAERADSSGVDIINTSLGYNTFDDESMDYEKSDMDGNTAVITRAAQVAASKGIFLVNSAGNSGTDPSWYIITAPADGEDVLAVGNVNLQGERSSSSSIGPAADGRIKPDVMALGVGVSVYRANGQIGGANGTSFASPLVASLVAGIRQRYPGMSSAELREAIRMASSKANSPDNNLGYGIPHYRAIINYIEAENGETGERNLNIFPNPVRDTFTISSRKVTQPAVTSFAIMNSQGQIMATNDNIVYDWPENTYSMDISHFARGVYFLTVRIGKNYETYMLVKI